MTALSYWGLALAPASMWAGADPADAYAADVGWWARQLRPGPHEPRFELRLGPAGTVLLGRVTAADRRTADHAAAAARDAALDLPGHVVARPLAGTELDRAIRPPWRPAAVVGVGKHVIRERSVRRPDLSYVAVQPFNAGPPAPGARPPAELLAAEPVPSLLSCLLVPMSEPPGLTDRLRGLATEYEALGRPVHVPAGIYGAGRTVPPEPFARIGSTLFRDAAARYRGAAYRFRAAIASAGPLGPALVEPLADTVSPPPPAPPQLPVQLDHPLRQVRSAPLTSVADELPPPASLSGLLAELADPVEAAAIARLPVPTAPRRMGRDGPELFVSYRTVNGDSARLLKTTLDAAFGPAAVFLDADSIHGGQRVQEEIRSALESCRLLLVVVDRDWLDTVKDGRRRLDDPRDWVRMEVEYALSHPVRVLPVLWNGTPLPPRERLPRTMRGMLEWKALEVRHPSAPRDLEQLVGDIRLALKQGPPAPARR